MFTQKHPPVYGIEELLLPKSPRTGLLTGDCLGMLHRGGVVCLSCPCLRELGLGTGVAGFKCKENQPTVVEKLCHQGNLTVSSDFALIFNLLH